MRYGQLAGNKAINKLIYQCFDAINDESEQLKFVNKFRMLSPDSNEIMHTFRELVLGAYLSENGHQPKYEYQIEGKTPDWSILDGNDITAIIEQVNFHIDNETEKTINQQVKSRGLASYWRDGKKNTVKRLWETLSDKARKYRALVIKLSIPYVLSLHAEFEVAIDIDEVKECLFDESFGIFKTYTEVTGLIYFQIHNLTFNYFPNPNALQTLAFSSGQIVFE